MRPWRQAHFASGLVALASMIALACGIPPAGAVGESPAVAYKLHCTGCHMDDGMGAKSGGIPPLPGIVGHFLRHEKGRLYIAHVPGLVNAGLTGAETAQLLNYVLEVWGAKETPENWQRFTGEEMDRLRATPVSDIMVLRNEIADDLARQGIDIRF